MTHPWPLGGVVASAAAGGSVSVSPAPLDRNALLLLPELAAASAMPEGVWFAHAAGFSAPVAAAAFSPRLQDARRPGFRAIVRVLPAWRRRGIGRALLLSVAEDARAWDVDHLHSWSALAEGAESSFLRALGWLPHVAVLHFVGGVSEALDLCDWRMTRRQRQSGRLEGGELVLRPLHQVPLAAVAALYAANADGAPIDILRYLAQSLQDESCRALSVAACAGDRLAGMLLARRIHGVIEADLWISAPAWRDGQVALLTLQGALQRAAAHGDTHFRFHCNERAIATLNFSRRIGAVLQQRRLSHCLPL